jgi:hypothetical protein
MQILSRASGYGGYYSHDWREYDVLDLFEEKPLMPNEEVGIYVSPTRMDPDVFKRQFELVRKHGGEPIFVFYYGWLKPEIEAKFREVYDIEPLFRELKLMDVEEWERLGGPWNGYGANGYGNGAD